MANISRTLVEQHALFDFVDRGIKIPVGGELRGSAAENSDSGKV
jgi:hypothetical protein